MNDKSQIQEFETEEQAKAAGYNISLTDEEAVQLQDFPEDQRLMQLAWIRFSRSQKRTPTELIAMKFAFTNGWKAAIEFVNQD